MAIAMGDLFKFLSEVDESLGEIANYPSVYADSEEVANDVASTYLLELQAVVDLLRLALSGESNDEDRKRISQRFALSKQCVTSAIERFDDPEDEEDESDEEESDESEEA